MPAMAGARRDRDDLRRGLYAVGMFAVTIVFNVPLNDQLAAADPASSAAAPVWARYLTEWTFWNHVRTAASIAATALFIAAIAAR